MAAILKKQLPSQQQIYNSSPRIVQRLLANLEAWRRDWFRRHGDYAAALAHYDASFYRLSASEQEAFQLERLVMLLDEARRSSYHYRRTLPNFTPQRLTELTRLPLLEKEHIRRAPLSIVSEAISRRELWPRQTSGSTGMPLRFYLDRETVRAHQATIDAMLAAHGCRFGERRARFSGTYVAPYEQTEPPFWMYIDHYHQLQCSAYHLAPAFYPHYLHALRETRVVYGNGYPTSWHLLAGYILETGDQPPPLKAIFSDSEGISLDQQQVVEKAFGCPLYQTYGTGEVGMVAMQCRQGRYHVLTRTAIVEITDDDGNPVVAGETGQVVVTSLAGATAPYIRYRTGDLATLAADRCPCGWDGPSLTEIVGRIDDRIKTPDGRWIGRLSHVTKPGVGIRESQIAQIASDRIIIRVVPERDFDQKSMEQVVATAHRYLGTRMQVTWELVERLPRTRAGKLRHVVREIEVNH